MQRHPAGYHIFCVVIATVLILSSCTSVYRVKPIPIPEIHESTPLFSTATSDASTSNWFQVYFTDPESPQAKNYEGGPGEELAGAIDQARLSVDIAAYSFNLWSLRDALIHAHQRGVVVRMVMESDNMDSKEIQQIEDAGIPVVGDQQEGLMHDKFVILDRLEVWTGSMNFTVGGAYKDNNNLVSIHSEQIAEDYTAKFEMLFTHHLFGAEAVVELPFPKINIDDTPVEIHFSPGGNVEARIVELINGAKETIYFLAYDFTSNEIGDAIINQAQTGVKIAGVMDKNQIASSQGTEYDPFQQAGLDVRLDNNQKGLMHHKVIIIDRKIIITGSYNFTASAEDTNDENVIIVFNPHIAMEFVDEFQRIYDQAQKVQQ